MSKSWFTWVRIDMLEMLLDQNRALERTPRVSRFVIILAAMVADLLLFDADKHLREQVALQVLPRFTVFTDSHLSMQAKLSEPTL